MMGGIWQEVELVIKWILGAPLVNLIFGAIYLICYGRWDFPTWVYVSFFALYAVAYSVEVMLHRRNIRRSEEIL